MDRNRFAELYPDVDPSTSLPATVGERFSLAVATLLFSYGAAYGDLLVLGVGLALLIFASVMPMLKVQRKIRNEARVRFPDQDWAEDRILSAVPVKVAVPVVWAIIALMSLAVLFLVPDEWARTVAGFSSLLAAVMVWFMPGLHPMWVKKVKRRVVLDEPPAQASALQHKKARPSVEETSTFPSIKD